VQELTVVHLAAVFITGASSRDHRHQVEEYQCWQFAAGQSWASYAVPCGDDAETDCLKAAFQPGYGPLVAIDYQHCRHTFNPFGKSSYFLSPLFQ